MRCDICKVIESNHASILSGMFVFIPNGLAEKAAFVFDWKEAINSDTDPEDNVSVPDKDDIKIGLNVYKKV